MERMRSVCVIAGAMAMTTASASARAEVVRIEIASRTDVLGGKAFGDAGAYEKIVGKAIYSVDPAMAANRGVIDLDRAPRDAAGRVTFTSDLYALVPKDSARGNGAAFFDVLNRGRKNLFRDFHRAVPVNDPVSEADFGDGFLMNQGFALVWVGWQFDIPNRDGQMGLQAPVATENGKPITGRLSTTFIPNTTAPTYRLDDLNRYADTTHYPPVDPASAASTLTERDGFLAPARVVPREDWQFGKLVDGKIVADNAALHLKGGFKPGHVYELSYEGKGGEVAGLGFVALRDLASALKTRSDLFMSARQAYVFGPSQDGRFLRQFLYEGFNADEQGRRGLDGIIANIAGSARGNDFNARFARPHGLGFFTASLFPYLDLDQTDPVSGKTDGLLQKLTPDTRPKIFYTNGSGEYWGGGRAAALVHTSLDGNSDVALADTTRVYLFAGTQHIPGGFLPSQGEGANQPNPNDSSFALRALALAMHRWANDGVAPPDSRYPRLSDGTLVAKEKLRFPAIPDVRSPLTIPAGYRADLGDTTRALPHLVPNVDPDGNELAGIRLPDVAAPLATYTGWNFRSPKIGRPEELLPLTGSYIPFAATRAAREQTGDPRLSIEERYASREAYEKAVIAACEKLVHDRYVLAADTPTMIGLAMARWDATAKGIPTLSK